jgi:D-alanyl-D-alanine carboxypeptidase
MNKKITPRIIKIIAAQCLIVIIAVTTVGAAIITHNQFKATANETTKNNSEVINTENSLSASSTSSLTSDGSNTTQENTVKSDYAYAYAGFNPKTTDVNVDLSKLIINANYALPDNYKPTLAEAVKGSDVQLDYRVAPYYQAMYDAAKADSITLTPVSGYRSYEKQTTNFENRIQQYMSDGMTKKEATIEAAKIIMLPGSSEHNAGLAMDICSLSESFENTDEFAWLSEHAADYGFILRYPKSEAAKAITGVTYEPWHYRYVGVAAAKEITQKGITLEQYVGLA